MMSLQNAKSPLDSLAVPLLSLHEQLFRASPWVRDCGHETFVLRVYSVGQVVASGMFYAVQLISDTGSLPVEIGVEEE